MENDIGWYHKIPTGEEYNIAVNEIQIKIQPLGE
ncbi:hypothetical protein MCW_01401 [Cardidatus Bartonella washoeensis 085-0475]|uniref:Uncharacterized protein n=1 Tax=Cardidatus Bartonella washoeensis 085-0475 TaxID=1094564 RepID=J1JF40_9HYPH|nr:hypothetical protein MCW_01401 [Bartonella washoeensis 085-0475]